MSWRRILLLSTALVAVLASITWALLQDSNVATDFLRRALQKRFAAEVDINDTTIRMQAGSLRIDGFTLADPTTSDRTFARFRTARVDVQVDPFGAGVAPRYVVVEGLQLIAGPTIPSAADLMKEIAAPKDDADAGLLTAPVIELRSGKATLFIASGEPPLVLDDIDALAAPLASDPTKLQLSGSAQLQEPPARLSLSGEIDLATGAAAISVATNAVTCSKQMVANLARLAKVDQQQLDVSGEIESLRVTCHVPERDAEDRTPTFEVEARCSEVDLDTPRLPPIVRGAEVRLYVNTSRGGQVDATVSQRNDAGAVDVCARVTHLNTSGDGHPQLELSARGTDLVINEDLRAALQSFEIGRRVVAGLEPTAGRADLQLYLRNPHVPGGDVELDLDLRDVAMAFHGFGEAERRIAFPLPLEHGRGRVRLRDKILMLQGVEAEIAATAGGGEVSLKGRINVQRGRGQDTTLDIEGRGVAFQNDLRSALATLLRDDGKLYDKLAPTGRADVRVAVRPRDVLPGGFDVEIRPRGAAMRWVGFPYLLDDLQGSIHVGHRAARFDLRGRHGPGALAMRGRIPTRNEHAPGDGFEAVVELEGLKLDRGLLEGVAVVVPELEAHWRRATPTGALSGAVKVWRPGPDALLYHDIRLQLERVDLALPVTPWRAADLSGQVLIQGAGPDARIDFDSLRGELQNGISEPAKLALLGHLETGPNVARDLAFVVRELELSDSLGETLDELNALDLQTWTSLAPAGHVDLVVREKFGGEVGPERDLDLVVQLVDVQSNARMLPRPAEKMTGELHIKNGELRFRDIRGELGGATVHCANGLVRKLDERDGRTEISFDVHARDFPVDDGLANLFTGPLRAAILQRELRGQADVDGLSLRFLVPGSDTALPFATTIRGTVGLDGVDLLLGAGGDGLRIQNIQGQVILAESTVDDAGGQLTGTLNSGAMSILGHPFESVESTFTADATQLVVHTMRTRIHDGELRHTSVEAPALTYTFASTEAPEGRLSADLQFDRVDVYALLSTSGWSNPPYRGLASGQVELIHLDGNNLVGAEATGALKVSEADLGKVPLFQAIYAQLPPADQPRFHQLDTQFQLTERAMQFKRLDVRSDILAVKGEGKLDLDGYLDVQMELDGLLGESADPLLMPFVEYIAKNLISFRLFGYLRDLRASTEFLGSRTPRRPAVLPVPPPRARPKPPGY